jgi:hypothetical protein
MKGRSSMTRDLDSDHATSSTLGRALEATNHVAKVQSYATVGQRRAHVSNDGSSPTNEDEGA